VLDQGARFLRRRPAPSSNATW